MSRSAFMTVCWKFLISRSAFIAIHSKFLMTSSSVYHNPFEIFYQPFSVHSDQFEKLSMTHSPFSCICFKRLDHLFLKRSIAVRFARWPNPFVYVFTWKITKINSSIVIRTRYMNLWVFKHLHKIFFCFLRCGLSAGAGNLPTFFHIRAKIALCG